MCVEYSKCIYVCVCVNVCVCACVKWTVAQLVSTQVDGMECVVTLKVTVGLNVIVIVPDIAE